MAHVRVVNDGQTTISMKTNGIVEKRDQNRIWLWSCN